MTWQFIEAVNGLFGARSSGLWFNSITAPTKMRAGDQLVAVIASDPLEYSISKTGGADITFDAGASSVQKIAGDGYVEFTISGIASYRILGLSIDDPGVTRDEIDYGIYVRNDAQAVSFFANGASLASTNVAPVAGDVWRLQRVGTTITAWLNGVLTFTYPTPSSAPLLVDTSFFNTGGSKFTGVHLVDAGVPVAITWQNAVNVTITNNGGDATNVITPNVDWDFSDTIASPTGAIIHVLRRIVTDDEPLVYTFDQPDTRVSLSAMLVYRGVENGALVGSSATNFIGITYPAPPIRASLRPTDLYMMGVFLRKGDGSSAVGNSGVWIFNGDGRANIYYPATGTVARRLVVCDSAVNIIGNVQRVLYNVSGNTDGSVFSALLPGRVPIGDRFAFNPPAMGAIGLPTKGV